MLKDPVWWATLAVALLLRAAPLLIWGWQDEDCTRDECIFKIAARPILEGRGLGLAPRGWLPAPGYPYLLAACSLIFGSFEAVKWVQWALTPALLAVAWLLGARAGGPRAARISAVLVAVHPTLIFYVGTMWTETVYSLLLSGGVLATLWAREGHARRAILPAVVLGAAVLTRGVATYLAPLYLLGLLAPGVLSAGWPTWRAEGLRRARHAAVFVAGLVLVVGPYSASASQRWGGFLISDATLGHVIGMGNDDFPPLTFDYMNGQLTGDLFARTLRLGRKDCPRGDGPLAHDRCEVERATAWIVEHPVEFVARAPERLAQLLNPHSFLTRHLRWNYWPGLPWELKEALVAYQAAFSALVVLGGVVAAAALARGPLALVAMGAVAYHTAIIAGLYGLTRFRLPWEPLMLMYVATAAAHPQAAIGALRSNRARAAVAFVTFAAAAWLMSRYAWTGWPGIFDPQG